jgi:tetratricopeptide (TPR) repeat protein
MHALFRTNRDAQLLQVLAQTDDHFHADGRWTESNMAALAASCLQNELFTQSAAYYEELIPLHQRTHPRRGIGNGTLSNYYAQQARAYAGLRDTPNAVESACGAIISWGHRHENRVNATQSLKQVLRDSPDLPAYLAHLDQETEEAGLDKPIIRKALGLVFLDQRQFDAAITQLNLALEAQPNDSETHQALIAAYEKQGDRQGVINQMLAAVQLRRRDIQLYKDLSQQLRDDPVRMERALTSIVEVLPRETESHTMLAEMRQNQNRWDDAIGHWKRVAELRALEPTGLLKLTEAQIHNGDWSDARESLEMLTSKSWPDRFGNVHAQARKLWKKVDRSGHPR